MIDFRYHLVSIVSIFLALAVGIVLGAGPLQQQIGTTLTSEVTQLRKDKSDLRRQLDEATTREKARGAFVTEALPRIVAGSLAGRGVALVVLPGAEQSIVEETTATIEAAGAALTTRVTITDAWTSTDEDAVTARKAATLAAAKELALPATDDTTALLDTVLATTLVTSEGQATTPGTAAKKALEGLRAAKLVEASTTDINPAQHVVVVSAPVTGGDARERETSLTAWMRLCRALDGASLGSVVLSDDGVDSNTGAPSVVTSLRADNSTNTTISTIDNGSQPLGQVSIPFALIQQEGNESGHFGIGPDASAPYAPIPTP